ncbi:4-alpha-glucanotransferase [candidate division GN15 bacterium]|nr:4-alpha-glucanotransferase [candidate division GN15 bacterium]
MTTQRASGILLHVTSIPTDYGIGDFGPAAYRFVDFLQEARQSYWQVLPLNPTDIAHGNSPYSSVSAFAMEPLLISPEQLVADGYLEQDDLGKAPSFRTHRIDYKAVVDYKVPILHRAWERARQGGRSDAYETFLENSKHWLDDFVLFLALKRDAGGAVWNTWDASLRDRRSDALALAREKFVEDIEREKFIQFLLFEQWEKLKAYANERGVQVIGDIPIYVNYDSVDVWSNPGIFKLDAERRPFCVAGVPPDYFSETGQLWGNPVYDWQALEDSGFEWWLRRLGHTLHLFDKVRIDHFRGLVAYWEVPADEETAINGTWVEVPSEAFFDAVRKRFPDLPIIAEDLGHITPDVWEVRDRYGFPGMKLVLFAFGEENPEHPYQPHNFPANCIAYTGTHDNNTARGWYETEASEEDKVRLNEYVGYDVTAETVHLALLRLIMVSVADTVVVPMQDVLGLDADSRMNVPSTSNGNWGWRLHDAQLHDDVAELLASMTVRYNRAQLSSSDDT